MNTNSTDLQVGDKKSNGDGSGWCPPGRMPILGGDGKTCLCDSPQYSVKPICLPQKPECYVERLGNGYTYYGENSGCYITHGRRRVES